MEIFYINIWHVSLDSPSEKSFLTSLFLFASPLPIPHLGTCRCASSPCHRTECYKKQCHHSIRNVLPEHLNRCFWSVATIIFWKPLKVFQVFVPFFFLCGVRLPEISGSESLKCDELRLFSFLSFQTGRVQLSARALGKVVLTPGKVHWSDGVHVS